MKVLDIQNLHLSFEDPTSGKRKVVIRGADLVLYKNEVLGIVGESGAGKSVLTTSALGLLPQNKRITKGKIIVNGVDVTHFSNRQWSKSKLLGSTITAVFQNPLETLNPYQKISKQLIESYKLNHKKSSKAMARIETIKILKELRFNNPSLIMSSYPHQLSGGMRQRIVIASALLTNPKILVLDEPTTALDPTVEYEIIELIKEIKKRRNLSVIIITHDLSVIAALADRINVMYAGKVVEYGMKEEIINCPQHPYTWGLLMSTLDADKKTGKFYSIPGRAPYNLDNIKGDAFAPRNKDYLLPIDMKEDPPFFKISKTHAAATWLLDVKAPKYWPPKTILSRWKNGKCKLMGNTFLGLYKENKKNIDAKPNKSKTLIFSKTKVEYEVEDIVIYYQKPNISYPKKIAKIRNMKPVFKFKKQGYMKNRKKIIYKKGGVNVN